MIELVFIVCLASAPTECEERALQVFDRGIASCMMSAQPRLAQWAETHPRWQVTRWTCQTPEMRKVRA